MQSSGSDRDGVSCRNIGGRVCFQRLVAARGARAGLRDLCLLDVGGGRFPARFVDVRGGGRFQAYVFDGGGGRLQHRDHLGETGAGDHAGRIAVGQLGEVAPPLSMLESLRKQRDIYASVQPIPAVIDVAAPPLPNQPGELGSARHQAKEHGERMRRYAAGIGADYLFLCGGTVDRATTDTAYTMANLTIVGAFVMPSQRIQANARASGSLIDVKSGASCCRSARMAGEKKSRRRCRVRGMRLRCWKDCATKSSKSWRRN